MKRNFYNYSRTLANMGLAVATALALTTSFTSCSSDDDDCNCSGSGNTTAGVIETRTGEKMRITEVGNIRYSYNDNGTLASFGSTSDSYEVSYNPFTITHINSGNGYSDKDVFSDIHTNSGGYITSLSNKYDYEGTEDEEHGTGKISVSYNGNGNITRMKGSGSGVYIEDGDKEKYSSSFDYVFTWNDGKLIKAVYTFVEDGEKDVETYIYNYTNAEKNLTLQYIPNFMSVDDNDFLGALFCIGYMGKGPSLLPSGVDYISKDDEGTEERYYDCIYYTNNDGTVYRYTGMTSGYIAYDNVEETTPKAIAKSASATRSTKKSIFRNIHNRFKNKTSVAK